jgi:ligand-binding sensor domain-containing protein
MFRGRTARIALAVVVCLAGFAGFAWWKASGAWQESADKTAAAGRIAFTFQPVEMRVPAGLDSLGTPRVYEDAVEFGGRVYVAGASGLLAYAEDGTLVAQYRPGLELPPARLTRLAVGRVGSDAESLLWIATAGQGVIAFDGRRFRQLLPEGALLRAATSLLVLPTGELLIGTEKAGVLAFDGSTVRPFHETLRDMPVTALAGTETGLWVGTRDRGVLFWRAGQTSAAEGMPDKQVLSLFAREGRAWAGTSLGVAELESARVTRTLAPGFFARAVMARGSRLMIGTLDEGALEIALDARGAKAVPQDVCADCTVTAFAEAGGRVLTVTQNKLFVDGRVWAEGSGSMLADRDVSALAVDRQGRLWVGYFDRGLEILGSRHMEDDVLFCVNRIVHDATRTLVATANGLVTFDSNGVRQKTLHKADGLIANHVTDVAVMDDGSIAAATPAGLTFVQASGASSIYAFQGLVNNHVYAVGANGSRLLAGTLGGLSIVDHGMVTASFTTANSGLRHNWITAFARAGEDWFAGTYGAGVLRFDSLGQWSVFPDLPKFEVNPNAMKASSCCVYAGTLGRGMAVYRRDSGRWSFFTAGLPSLNVTAVEERGGVLYIGTDNGAVRLPEASVWQ